MANKIHDNHDPAYDHKATAGAAIVANDMVIRDSTNWIPCTDGTTCEGIAITAASASGVEFLVCRQPGLRMLITGSLAVNAQAYVLTAQSIDAGTAGNKSCGVVDDTIGTNNVVRMAFPANDVFTHA